MAEQKRPRLPLERAHEGETGMMSDEVWLYVLMAVVGLSVAAGLIILVGQLVGWW
ncbi:hypothetical protein J2Y48_003153 [Mycoplana sp. BE70]|uniref:hypothetical protein n=1 Tax=Mycoplana sp. BE70 TaxID=2817775 RepID=UPI00285F5E3B|nr:hypothetical protein [Mycoplana sp. BE70]MDR6757856.1 hypothetical protein [Mycoplana sp. BE70]